MDRIDEMRVFARVVETRSFRQAAEDLGIPASTATDAIKRIERRLGVRLIDRTTRVVAATLDGQAWYQRCLAIITAMEDAENAFSQGSPKGPLHVNVHGTLARYFLLPQLPQFLAENPGIDLMLSEEDRLVDLIREGVDCVVRVGVPADSDLIARRLGELSEITLASPDYLLRHGTPESPHDLDGHVMVAFYSSQSRAVFPLEFESNGKIIEKLLPVTLTVTAAETLAEAARSGMGLIQAPKYHFTKDLASGQLVEILGDTPPQSSPVSALYPRDRQLSPRVRVFLDWLDRVDFEV